MSCRRQQDGGNWTGTEPDRIALLRQCIISKADYVEIRIDVIIQHMDIDLPVLHDRGGVVVQDRRVVDGRDLDHHG